MPVRLSGQDSRRGTFSHAACGHLRCRRRGEPYIPLRHLAPDQARICIYNCLLSRGGGARLRLRLLARLPGHALPLGGAVRRFREWRAGRSSISSSSPRNRNGSGRAASCCSCRTATKARARNIPARGSSVFSSSARRTTSRSATSPRPAQYFHVLRRQMKRDFRKPLIIMTPKSLLARRARDLARGGFHERRVSRRFSARPEAGDRPEQDQARHPLLRQSLLRSAEVTRRRRRSRTRRSSASSNSIRSREEKLRDASDAFPKTRSSIWCQEESQNMGAWTFIEPRLRAPLRPRDRVCRPQRERESGGRVARRCTSASRRELIWEAFLVVIGSPPIGARSIRPRTAIRAYCDVLHEHRSQNSRRRRIDFQRGRFRLAQEIRRARQGGRAALHPRDRQGLDRDHGRESGRARDARGRRRRK